VEYIERQADGSFELQRYEAYATAQHVRLSALMGGEDLHTADRNGLVGKRTLHDAWLLDLRVVHPRGDDEATAVHLRLLGAYHDRYFVIRYQGVSASKVEVPEAREDLLAHEVRLRQAGGLVHELLFASGRAIVIECLGIEFTEEPVEMTQ